MPRQPEADHQDRQPLPGTRSRRAAATTSPISTPTDATVEDPVGGEVHIGRQAIRGFYSSASRTPSSETEVVTLRALGNEAAFFWRLTVDLGDGGMRIEIISVMTFDDDGKITSMKAYWGPDNITQL